MIAVVINAGGCGLISFKMTNSLENHFQFSEHLFDMRALLTLDLVYLRKHIEVS